MSKIISALFTGIIVVSIWAVFSINKPVKPVKKDLKDIKQGCTFVEDFNNIRITICTKEEIRLGE